MAQLRDDWVYTTRIHSTDAAFSKRSCHEVASVHLWTRPDKTQGAKAAALFSRLAVSQPMKNKSRSKNLSGVDYADPAFSPDPLSNPNFFSSKQSPALIMTTPACPGHPTPKKQRPPAKGHIPPPPPNSPVLPGPTTTDISTVQSTINSPPFTTSLYSSPRPHPAVPPPSSSPPSFPKPHVHTKADMPQDATLLRRHSHHSLLPSQPEHKKPHGILSKLFGLSSSEPSKSSTSSSSSQPPPSKNRRRSSMLFVPQSPPLPQNRSPLVQPLHQRPIAGSPLETSAMENPQRQTKVRTAAQATRITPAVAAPPPVDDQWMHQDLDRIDELDESSPFGGVMMHNGGPYEAIPKFVHTDFNSKPHVRPPRAQQNGGRGLMMSGDVYRNAQIIALQKGSLNLKPGQVLPHNPVPRVEISHHPYPQPDSQPHCDRHNYHPHHTFPEPDVPIRDSRSPIDQLGPVPTNPSLPQAALPKNHPSSSITNSPSNHHDRMPSPSPTPTVIQYDDQDSGFAIGMAMISPDDENTLRPTTVLTVVNHSSETGSGTSGVASNKPSIETSEPSPPPYTLEPPMPLSNETRYVRTDESHIQGVAAEASNRGQAFNMHETTQLPTRMPSTFSLSRSGTWQQQPVQMSPPPPHLDTNRREVRSLEPLPLQERLTPPDPRLHRAATYAPSSPRAHTDRSILLSSLQRSEIIPHSSDARSVQQSIMTASNASRMTGSSQTREGYRRNPYLPKHLIMPTPLQPALQNQAMVEQGRLDPRASPAHSRDSSPSKRRSTLVTSPIPRAENIPVAPSGGKLRKRVSLLGGKKEQASSVAAVSFLANIVTSDKNDNRTEKQRKNVLNKRK